MSEAAIQAARELWELDGCDIQLVAERENRVYRVTRADGSKAALRLHRPGYRTDLELQSELSWIRDLKFFGMNVPLPILSQKQNILEVEAGFQIDLITWLEGDPLGTTGSPLVLKNRPETFFQIGCEMARLHNHSDKWRPPDNFTRCKWDADGLLGEVPLWGRFWENPTLSAAQQEQLLEMRGEAIRQLLELEGRADFGLIHADLVRENILVEENTVHFIDFDDCGFGYRLFDIATALFKNRAEPDYKNLEAALLDGYRSRRFMDSEPLPLFMAMRAFSYVGWIIPRMDEPGGLERNHRFIANALVWAERLLER